MYFKKSLDTLARLVGRYGLVGVLLLSLDFGTYTLLILSGYDPSLAQFCARTMGAFAGYLLHRNFTFRKGSLIAADFFREGPAYLSLVCFNLVTSPLLVTYMVTMTKNPFLGKIISECFLVIFTFFIMRFFIFKSNA